MFNKDRLIDTIIKLIYLKKEDVYWDFKQEWGSSNIDLVHDIICMANIRHDGDRYLIYGIKDKTYTVLGLKAR